MGTISAQSIIDSVKQVTMDSLGKRWPDPELLDWLSAGQREIVTLNPSAGETSVVGKLVAGTKQAAPAGGLSVFGINRNMGADGATAGTVPTRVEKQSMDRFVPSWHSSPAEATVKHYIPDDDDPGTYYVYPPQPSAPNYVDLSYSSIPDPVASATDVIDLDDGYANALINYILSWCFSKDIDESASDNRSNGYYQKFLSAIGSRIQNANMEGNK